MNLFSILRGIIHSILLFIGAQVMMGWAKTEFAASAQVVVGWAKLKFTDSAQVVVGWSEIKFAASAQVVVGWSTKLKWF